MLKVSFALILAVLAVALAEPRVQLHRGLTAAANTAAAPGAHPYLFLTVPRGRAGSVVQGFEVLEEDVDDNVRAANDDEDSDEAENDDDDIDDDDDEPIVGFVQNGNLRATLRKDDMEDEDEDEDEEENEMDSDVMQVVGSKTTPPTQNNLQMILQNAKPTQMMVSKEHAGAIMVPDGIIEIEGQRIIDEKTGKAALLVPREALDAIPDGSVVALMERSAGDLSDEDEEERANRVIVRRRRRGSRRNVRRRGGNNRNRYNRRRVNNNNNRNKRRRRVNRRNVRVVRTGNNNRRRRGNRRRQGGNRPVIVQG